ncbi:MAG: HlyC/CorC family transporter [Acidimicrobiia bacterium]|nr:hemolysin family protein [Acidimicrobiia bacterium]MBT8193517.1 hemolysin family protein [Acidimicrobiia bacterium]NNF89386.1 HlyC/CorC family transporter [Acidimicrobiia bacterium]NNJ46466.1 HlyC/CorC family transporter [Acidimicrobiia bacterium]NNL13765.1 HlyC/CorC family transporter [Acidimicrobiia bacterium]
MSGINLIYLGILAVCIVASGFFSGSETAIIGIQRERVHQLAARDRRGRKLEALLADPDRTLSTLLIANNFVNILAASVATALFIDLAGESWGPWIVTFLLTGIILIFGEIGPKTLAHRHPEGFSLFVAGPISNLSRVLQPFSTAFTFINRGLFRLFRVKLNSGMAAVTEDDIRALAALSESSGEIEAAEREIIDALFSLADRAIREVMTPRVDMVSLTAPLSQSAVQDAVTSTGHSRFPVVADTHDEILGILAVKDLLRLPPDASSADIARLLRPPTYIPESRPVLAVLQEMRRSRFGFGVVVDEHGGVEGIATTKDVISELVGSLQDEYDPTVPSIIPAGAGRWVVDGRTDVDELEAEVGRELPRGDYSTVAGLFMDETGRIPDEGDHIVVDGVSLTVLLMDRRRIARLRVEI